MNQSNLILHCGAAKTERSELALVCTPDADNTWCPIPHQTLVAEVEGASPAPICGSSPRPTA